MRRSTLIAVGFVAALGAGACAQLLGIREGVPEHFAHHAHAIKGITCTQCHKGIASAGETGPLHIPTTQDCIGCHEKPHDTHPCLKCHGEPSTRRLAAERRKYILFRHDQHMKEVHGNCAKCHLGVAEEDESAGAPMGACLGCHEHKDEFKLRQCEQCHVGLKEGTSIPQTHLIHDANFLDNHGTQAASAGDVCATCHRESFCAQCHGVTVPVLPSRFRFEDTMRQGMHRANFFARHAEEAHGQPGLCRTCHTQQFCSDCHLDRGVSPLVAGSRNPHPPGWVGALGDQNAHGRAARRDPASCAGCHGGPGEMLCVGCHKVGGIGGNPHPAGWSSRKGLSEMPCRLCHLAGGMP